ncbi:hypothetical protein OMF49_17960, partial [Bordetella pertussis]
VAQEQARQRHTLRLPSRQAMAAAAQRRVQAARQSLRERVVLIGQRPYLYAGSIADNIRLARPGASAALVEEAARVLDEVLAFAQGRTLLLATHADAVARRLPRQWMLEQGRLRELQPA